MPAFNVLLRWVDETSWRDPRRRRTVLPDSYRRLAARVADDLELRQATYATSRPSGYGISAARPLQIAELGALVVDALDRGVVLLVRFGRSLELLFDGSDGVRFQVSPRRIVDARFREPFLRALRASCEELGLRFGACGPMAVTPPRDPKILRAMAAVEAGLAPRRRAGPGSRASRSPMAASKSSRPARPAPSRRRRVHPRG